MGARPAPRPKRRLVRVFVVGPGNPNDPSSAGTQPSTPAPQIEAGSPQDMFVVYRGSTEAELVSTRCPGRVAVFRQRCARIAFGSSGRGLPQADRGVGEATGLPSVASDPMTRSGTKFYGQVKEQLVNRSRLVTIEPNLHTCAFRCDSNLNSLRWSTWRSNEWSTSAS